MFRKGGFYMNSGGLNCMFGSGGLFFIVFCGFKSLGYSRKWMLNLGNITSLIQDHKGTDSHSRGTMSHVIHNSHVFHRK
jgi:hypothetical protein